MFLLGWRPTRSMLFACCALVVIWLISLNILVQWCARDTEKVLPHRHGLLDDDKPRLGDGCWHIYLDVGSNIGVQVRKLFEPHRYPKADILPYFESYFHIDPSKPVPRALPPITTTNTETDEFTDLTNPNGSNNDLLPQNNATSHICAFGWEPNPHHVDRLNALEEAYTRIGWRTTFFTETAVGVSDTDAATFYLSEAYLGWAVSNFPTEDHVNEGGKVTRVPYIDLSRFVLEELVNRKLPSGDENVWGKPAILMKMDIEGGEFEVLPHMLFEGSLCHLDVAFVEYHEKILEPLREAHPEKEQPSTDDLLDFVLFLPKVHRYDKKHCKIQVVEMNDGSYMYDGEPFPE